MLLVHSVPGDGMLCVMGITYFFDLKLKLYTAWKESIDNHNKSIDCIGRVIKKLPSLKVNKLVSNMLSTNLRFCYGC